MEFTNAMGAMRLLATSDLTADERIAIADEPRNGVWWQPSWMRGGPADRRPLTQEQTDRLIALELRDVYNDGPDGEMTRLTAQWAPTPIDVVVEARIPVPNIGSLRYQTITVARTARRQRNGIHSDPMIRLLAFRAFGERDRKWFTLIDMFVRTAASTGIPVLSAVRDADALMSSLGEKTTESMRTTLKDIYEWFAESR